MKSGSQHPLWRHPIVGGGTALAFALVVACGDSITGPAPVASVSVTFAAPTVAVGTKTQAFASVKDDGGNILDGRTVTWSSSNTEVASVSSTGEVTALRTGTAEIKATSEGKEGTATVTVIPPPVASVAVTLASPTVAAGNTTTATAVLSDANGNVLTGRTVTWSSSDVAIATVSDQGVVTALKAGNASIIATSEGKTGSAPLTVTPPAIHTITVTIANPALHVGETTQASAVAKDANGNDLTGRPIVWTTSNAEVATVNEQGIVTAVKVGTATITATSEGKSGSANVAVGAVPIHSITVVFADPQISVGASTQASAIAKDANGTELTGRPIVWTTDNAEIATVSAQGIVSGVRVGTATITATSEGKSGAATITVYPLGVASVTVTLGKTTLVAGDTTQATATVRDAGGKVLPGYPVTWSVASSTFSAWVFPNGKVKAEKAGSAEIIATVDGKTGSATLTVTAGTEVRSIFITNYQFMVAVGQTAQPMTVIVSDAGGNRIPATLVWSSSNPEVATVDANGAVTGTGVGKAVITASSGEVKDAREINVIIIQPHSLSAGYSHTCAISTEGDAYCWGSNTNGELGDETSTPRTTPVLVHGGLKFQTIHAGYHITYGQTRDGRIFCWGGRPCAEPWHVPGILSPRQFHPAYPIHYLNIGHGVLQSPNCGIATDNNAYCWGTSNESNQAGHNTNNSIVPAIPVRKAYPDRTPVKMKELGAGMLHACGITLNGSAECWGSDAAGQLGRNGTGGIGSPEPVAGGYTFKHITAGDEFSCALDLSGAAYCWGDNTYGQLGAVTTPCLARTTPCSTTPVAVLTTLRFESIDAGGREVCAVTSGGDIYCWGEQFGPAPVPFGAGVSYRIVSVGSGHACATSTGGEIYCRNKNASGQLGNGTTVDSPVPTRVAGGVSFKAP